MKYYRNKGHTYYYTVDAGYWRGDFELTYKIKCKSINGILSYPAFVDSGSLTQLMSGKIQITKDEHTLWSIS